MVKTQKYGIKFPFNILSEDKTLLDLNKTKGEQVKSQLMHLLFTQKGQRLRSPDFGTNLLQYFLYSLQKLLLNFYELNINLDK